jgi:hypothetical protein
MTNRTVLWSNIDRAITWALPAQTLRAICSNEETSLPRKKSSMRIRGHCMEQQVRKGPFCSAFAISPPHVTKALHFYIRRYAILTVRQWYFLIDLCI